MLDNSIYHFGCNADGFVIHSSGLANIRKKGFDSYKWVPGETLISTESDSENAEIAVNRYKALVSLCDWLIFSFSE
jgi:hypothetical protein